MNIVNGTLRRGNGSAYVETPGGLRWPIGRGPGTDGQFVSLGVRPEHLSLAQAAGGGVHGEIIVVEPMGAETELLIKAGEAQLTLMTTGRPNVNPGERIGLALDPATIHLFDQKSGQRLAA
jgi:multiple sugar transport system ATP-binding protein